MTVIYLINNSLTLNNLSFPDKDSLESKREKRILSIEGEKESAKLAFSPLLKNINVIYASSYVMSIATAKYLASNLEQDINITPLLNERRIGHLGTKKLGVIREIQESDFSYKLPGGESLDEVKDRMKKFINEILKKNPHQEVAAFTHNVAITSLLESYCQKGFNLDNRLILNYQDESIIDGTWSGINIIKLEFDNQELINIKRIK